MRVDIHPEEYCVLNSTNKDVVDLSIIDLKYCYSLLEQFNIKNKTLILHVGGSTFGKKQGLARFINNYKKLPKQIQEAIAVENDDKIYNIDDYASCICELFYNAVKDDDLDKVIKISYNVGEWGDYKGEEAREQFEDAMQQWVEENPYKAERIDDYFRKHRDVIPK